MMNYYYKTGSQWACMAIITVCLGLKASLTYSVGTPISLDPSPESSLSTIMESGFFAEKLMQKRHILYRGGQPSMTLGGTFKLNLNKDKQLHLNPSVSSIVLNPVIVFDRWILLTLSVRQGEDYKGLRKKKSPAFELEKYALVFGDAHANSAYTRVGAIRLPFKVYAALGKFNTPFLNYASEGVFASYAEKVGYRLVEGCAIGLNLDQGLYGINIAFDIPQSRVTVRDMNVSGVLYQPHFNFTLGGSYTSNYNDIQGNSGGGVHAGLFMGAVKTYCELLWPFKELSKKGNRHYTTHAEVVWRVLVKQYPISLIAGYSDSRRTKSYSIFGSVKTELSRYSKVGFGIEMPISSEEIRRSVRDRSIRDNKTSRNNRFLAQCDFSF